MSKSTAGLRKRGRYWWVEKTVSGVKLYESTGETELEQAERYLAMRIQQVRSVIVYGDKLERTFDTAAARYIEEYEHKRSLDRDITSLKSIMPFIGTLPLRQVHNGTLDSYIKARKATGISAGTLNRDMAVIRRILNLSAKLWRDDQGRPWLDTVPMLPIIQGTKRKPRPISQPEQQRLIKEMPQYLADMVLFALHTGLRDQELCGLQWQHEMRITGTTETVFIITEERAKNNHERIVPLNAVAKSIINRYRGQADTVFHLKSKPLERMNNRAWRKARTLAGLESVRVHDLRHTFGMRLRAAGVSEEDRKDLLGHHNGSITTHYSRVEIQRLIDCVNLLCDGSARPELTLVKVA